MVQLLNEFRDRPSKETAMMPLALMRMILKYALMVLLSASIAVYAGDWLVYRYRVAHGTAFDSVLVDEFLSVPLKGQKVEYNYLGQQPVECVRTLLPWAGEDPCWWVRRHAENWTRA
jgi:hypothetical protein